MHDHRYLARECEAAKERFEELGLVFHCRVDIDGDDRMYNVLVLDDVEAKAFDARIQRRINNDIFALGSLMQYGVRTALENPNYADLVGHEHYMAHPNARKAQDMETAAIEALKAYLLAPEYVPHQWKPMTPEEIFRS